MPNNPFEPGEKNEKVGCTIAIILYICWIALFITGDIEFGSTNNWEDFIGRFFMIIFIPMIVSYIITWILYGIVIIINRITNVILPHRFSVFKFIGKYIIAPVIVGSILGYVSFLVTGEFRSINGGISLVGSIITIAIETKA